MVVDCCIPLYLPKPDIIRATSSSMKKCSSRFISEKNANWSFFRLGPPRDRKRCVRRPWRRPAISWDDIDTLCGYFPSNETFMFYQKCSLFCEMKPSQFHEMEGFRLHKTKRIISDQMDRSLFHQIDRSIFHQMDKSPLYQIKRPLLDSSRFHQIKHSLCHQMKRTQL